MRDVANLKTCKWTQDDFESELWETECGEAFGFIDYGPDENSMKFCAYCGGRLIPVAYTIPNACSGTQDHLPSCGGQC